MWALGEARPFLDVSLGSFLVWLLGFVGFWFGGFSGLGAFLVPMTRLCPGLPISWSLRQEEWMHWLPFLRPLQESNALMQEASTLLELLNLNPKTKYIEDPKPHNLLPPIRSLDKPKLPPGIIRSFKRPSIDRATSMPSICPKDIQKIEWFLIITGFTVMTMMIKFVSF